jgi:hypothetical protein
MLVKVNNANMVRDTESMALMNTDNSEKNEYYNKLRMVQKQKEQINKVNEEIAEIKNEMGDIKQLLQQLLDRQ